MTSLLLAWPCHLLQRPRHHIDAERQNQHIEAKGQHAVHQREPAHLARGDLHVGDLRGHAAPQKGGGGGGEREEEEGGRGGGA